MEEEGRIREDLLLSLGLGACCSTTAASIENRKARSIQFKDAENSGSSSIRLSELLRARERMMRLDPRRSGLEDARGEQLIHLLLVAASAIETNHEHAAIHALADLYQHVSFHGDPIQRVMAYFADGLFARIITASSHFYPSIMENPTPEDELAAFTALYRASPFFQFAHFTANQTIMEAFEAEEKRNGRRLHVIDFDVSYGFQWPSLIQSLADKASTADPISLRLTGFGRSVDELRETESRLVNFSKGCSNLVFEFDGVLIGSTTSDLKIEKNATLVVNLAFYLQTLKSSSEMLATLMAIHSLNPSAVVLVEKEGRDQESATFLASFVDNLNYFAAMFHSLHDCLPAESAERLSIEKNHLGREIKIAITGTTNEKVVSCWRRRMESVGFQEMKLSSRSVSQAKLLLKIKGHFSSIEHVINSGFGIAEGDEGGTISLCWQDRNLVTVSAWRCGR
ncbi:scarecrow-like protein 23 [Canna indica]|uniref:Scarecrow-like protein 23 n=1 Tax=Canna indica TaxID=4628 RepID=A0AAQ3QK84_9LILI|nr:scarecrow-like protein 23 [Canna indica]